MRGIFQAVAGAGGEVRYLGQETKDPLKMLISEDTETFPTQ